MERTWHLELEEIDSEPIYEDEEKEIYLLDWDYSAEDWVVRHPIYAIWEAEEWLFYRCLWSVVANIPPLFQWIQKESLILIMMKHVVMLGYVQNVFIEYVFVSLSRRKKNECHNVNLFSDRRGWFLSRCYRSCQETASNHDKKCNCSSALSRWSWSSTLQRSPGLHARTIEQGKDAPWRKNFVEKGTQIGTTEAILETN